jgi:hypothetical protein
MASTIPTPGLTDAQLAAVAGMAQALQSDPTFLAAFQKAAAGAQTSTTRSAPGSDSGGVMSPQQLIAALDQIKAMLQSGTGAPGTGAPGTTSSGGTGAPGWPTTSGPVTRSPAHAAAAAAAVGLA